MIFQMIWERDQRACVRVCVRVFAVKPQHSSVTRFPQLYPKKPKCHILFLLLWTSLHSPVNRCRRVNVELKTIKTTFWDKESFQATDVGSHYLKYRGGNIWVMSMFFQLYGFTAYIFILTVLRVKRTDSVLLFIV